MSIEVAFCEGEHSFRGWVDSLKILFGRIHASCDTMRYDARQRSDLVFSPASFSVRVLCSFDVSIGAVFPTQAQIVSQIFLHDQPTCRVSAARKHALFPCTFRGTAQNSIVESAKFSIFAILLILVLFFLFTLIGSLLSALPVS